MRESSFIDIISGRKRGIFASAARGVLQAAEPFYFSVTQLRNLLFDYGLKNAKSAAVPVIAVGNITTGGTGKTPTVAWLIRRLQALGYRPGIVSRGYRSLDGEANDEKLLLDQLCPGVPHFQDRNRYAATQALLSAHDCNVLILDDGFQHRRLKRDFDLVLIDALNPFGHDHLLPRGLLRESLRNLKRCDALLVTRTDHADRERVHQIVARATKYKPGLKHYTSEFQPVNLINSGSKTVNFSQINGKRMCAFAGIGNPSGFRRTLAATGLAVDDRHFQAYPDHHHYTADDLSKLGQWAKLRHVECLITTRKDLVKINRLEIEGIPLWAVDIQLKICSDSSQLEQQLLAAIETGSPPA